MGFIKTLASVVCLAWLFIASSSNSQELLPGQIVNTGNIVNYGTSPTTTTSTWQNVGLVNQGLPCWGPGGPIYCGPQPYYNQGSFNFSYGTTDVYQIANIAAALPNSGTGLRVNGFNFNFTAKNGNGWDDGRQDYLVAYVSLYDSTGKVANSYDYSNTTNRKYNWTTFNFSETFNTPYATSDLSTVRYGFVGRDNNFWAGPYGPEVTNISFSLKYSVDPCYVNVLSSPSCPGYLEALNKLSPKTTNETPTTIPNSTIVSTAPSVSSAGSTPTDSVTATTVPAATTTTTITQPVVSSSTASTSVTPTATNPQPKVGEVTVSGSPAKTTISTSQILAIVRSEQSRISNLEQTTSEQAVTQAQAAANAAVSQSQSVSAATIQQSQSNLSFANTLPNITSGSSFSSNVNSNQSVMSMGNQQSNTRANTYSLTLPNQINNYVPPVTVSSISLLPKQDSYKLTNEENTRSEGMKFSGTDFITNSINSVAILTNETRENKSASVNQQTQDNDLAGGISIAAIAKQPIGFDAYSQMLKDVAFYAPKEIYRNQNVVDNARAQRGLQGGSDRLHQEMVDSQYNRK